jgi:surface protein
MYKIEIINKDTNEVKIYDNLNDLNFGEKKFYRFELDLTDLADGKYIVNLYEDDKLIITDDLNVGDFNVNSLQKKVGENIYISTKVDTKLQEKNVEITDVETSVTPDEGFDAITILNINAQTIRDNAFAEGVQSVVDNSVELDINNNGVYLTKYTGGEGELVNKINVKVEGGLDFSSIGYTQEETNAINASYNEGIRYAKEIADNWNVDKSSLNDLFEDDTNLIYFPQVDTSKANYMNGLFKNCVLLKSIPLLNTSRVSNAGYLFYNCCSLEKIPFLDTSNFSSVEYMFASCTNLKQVPLLNFENVTIADHLFKDCKSLTTIPPLNLSKATNLTYLFDGCKSLTTIPQIDISSATDIGFMFANCTSLTSIPMLNTSNVTSTAAFVQSCTSLTTIPQLDTSNVTMINSMFSYSYALESIPLLDFGKVTSNNYVFSFGYFDKLTDLGGFKDLKINWNDAYCLNKLPKLTYQSVFNVINNLYDFRANGDTTTTRTLKLHSNSYALLTEDDFALANGKGWNITK